MQMNLALQGGGALGALTWGVLDRLLEDPSIDFDGVSGASAGAMNAVALAHGLALGGDEGRAQARVCLEKFWTSVGQSSYAVTVSGRDGTSESVMPASSKFLLGLTRFFSPYQLNPFDINPLRKIVEDCFDFERIRRSSPLKLFVAATEVRSGALRLFRETQMTPEHVLASACLPAINQAVIIDGEAYWDGGYSGNPAVYPLVYECESADILVVMLLPLRREKTPTTAEAIRARATEIHFNATLLRELRSIGQAQLFAQRSLMPLGSLERRVRSLRVHLIATDDLVSRLAVEKTMNTSLAFLLRLKEEGRQRAGAWLEEHGPSVGKRGTVDIAKLFC